MVSFKRQLSDGSLLEFELVENELPVVMKDKGGSKWDVFGNAVSGPGAGAQLEATNSSQLTFFEIKKKELDRFQVSEMLTQKWPEIMANTEIVPHIVGGKIQGFELRNSNLDSPLKGLGILNGDIITEVNGIKLIDAISLFKSFETIRKSGKFIVGLKRNGRPIRFLYAYQ